MTLILLLLSLFARRLLFGVALGKQAIDLGVNESKADHQSVTFKQFDTD